MPFLSQYPTLPGGIEAGDVLLVGRGGAAYSIAGSTLASGLLALFLAPTSGSIVEIEAVGTNIGIALVPSGTGALSLTAPDQTAVGGNARGANAVDLQMTRQYASEVASGASSAVLGGSGNIASAQYATAVGGQGNSVTGIAAIVAGWANAVSGIYGAIVGGLAASDRGLFGSWKFASGLNAAVGDSQIGMHVLRGISTSTTALRLTADGNTAGSANVVNIPANTAYALRIDVVGKNLTTAGNAASATLMSGILDCGANAAATVWTAGNAGTLTNHGTGLAALPTIAADTTNGGLSITVTPPNSNTWHWVARVTSVEAQ